MTLGERERRLLGWLVAVLVLAAAYRLWPLLQPAGEPADTVAAARAEDAKVVLPELRVAVREADPGNYTPGRDPFRFGTPPAPPPPPPPSKAELEAERRRQEEAERARQEAERQRQIYASTPHPPPIDVRFLGSFGPQNRRIAVFGDAAGRLMNVTEGEVLEGKFLVWKIGFESVDLKFVGFPDEPAKRLPAGGALGNVP